MERADDAAKPAAGVRGVEEGEEPTIEAAEDEAPEAEADSDSEPRGGERTPGKPEPDPNAISEEAGSIPSYG